MPLNILGVSFYGSTTFHMYACDSLYDHILMFLPFVLHTFFLLCDPVVDIFVDTLLGPFHIISLG